MKCPYCDAKYKMTWEEIGGHLVNAHPFEFAKATALNIPEEIIKKVYLKLAVKVIQEIEI